MTRSRPFPLIGALAAAVASLGLLQDTPVLAAAAALAFALVAVVGFLIHRRRARGA